MMCPWCRRAFEYKLEFRNKKKEKINENEKENLMIENGMADLMSAEWTNPTTLRLNWNVKYILYVEYEFEYIAISLQRWV